MPDLVAPVVDGDPERSPTVREAMRRLRLAVDTRKEQLDREKAALRFQVAENQWDQTMRDARGPTTIDGVSIPPRPMLSIPKLNQPIQLILNQEKTAHLGVMVHPLDEDANDDTAEVYRDLYRNEERRSRAGLARSWAFDRAVKAGWGVYAIDTTWDDESNNPFDQRINWRRILYQDLVYLDPTVQEPDWSDMEWALELTWQPHSRIRREHPESTIAKYDDGELRALAGDEPEWVKFTTGDDTGEGEAYCLVAVYWRKQYRTRVWVVLDDGSFSYEDEIPEGKQIHPDPAVGKRREVQVPTVYRSILTVTEELNEPEEWNGQYIPLIPCVGIEIQPYDGKRRWQGVIEPSMDAQRLFNFAASSAVELAALEPKAPWVMYDGQDEGHEQMWMQSAIRNFPALKVNPNAVGPGGQPLPFPQRTQVDVGRLGPSMMLLDKAEQFIQASTTTLDQTRIEQMGRRRVAHQTINALQEQSEFGNSHYLHNMQTITMPYEAKVVLDLMAKIYDRPGRVARLLDMEDNQRAVVLNAPFHVDPRTKRPIRVGEGLPPQGEVKHFDLRKGKYGVTVSIGKSWQSRVEAGADEIGQILTADPALMPLIGPTYFRYRDFPGSKEIAELLKKVRSRQYPDLDNDGAEESPAMLKGKLQQAGAAFQQLQQQLAQAADIIKTKQVEKGADIERERLKQEYALRLAEMEHATRIRIAEIAAETKGIISGHEAEHEALALGREHAHQAQQATADRMLELTKMQMQRDQSEQQATMPNGNGSGE